MFDLTSVFMASCKQSVSWPNMHPTVPGDLAAWTQGQLRENTAAALKAVVKKTRSLSRGRSSYPWEVLLTMAVTLGLCLSYAAAVL